MRLDSPLLALPLSVRGTAEPDGRMGFTLLEQGSTVPIGSLTGAPPTIIAACNFNGRFMLSGRPLALAAAYVDVSQVSGTVQAEIHARMRWPLPLADAWKQVVSAGDYRLQLAASSARVTAMQARAAGSFTIANGTVKAAIDAGGAISADAPELEHAAKRIELGSRVSLTNDRVVKVEYAQRALRVGEGLTATFSAAGKPFSFRPSGEYGDRHFELAIAAIDGAPILVNQRRAGRFTDRIDESATGTERHSFSTRVGLAWLAAGAWAP